MSLYKKCDSLLSPSLGLLHFLLFCACFVRAQAPVDMQPPISGRTTQREERSRDETSVSDTRPRGVEIAGQEVPLLDPGSEIVSWDGKVWRITNQRLLRSRFEKYLSAPEQTTEDDLSYQKILDDIRQLLAPERISSSRLDEAWGLLRAAASYEMDAKLSDSLAEAVYAAWLSKREISRIEQANRTLERQREALEWNMKMAATRTSQGSAPRDPARQQIWLEQQRIERDLRVQPHASRLAEVTATLAANRLRKEASELQAKLQFQTLIAQFFAQRRFEHVVIAIRFYREIFQTGDLSIQLGEDAAKVFSTTTGMPPTLGVLDSVAHEVMRDVREGVNTFNFLLENNELASASDRLMETFLLGEFLPPIKTLPRERKRRVLTFVQKSNELLNALEVKDYTLAYERVEELKKIAADFDASKPLAAIETARTLASMHLAKARNAAVSGDRETLERELRAATEIWPRNPELKSVSETIFSQSDLQQQALMDFDRLVQQNNQRQIFADQLRFIAATVLFPERQEILKNILERMTKIEAAILRAREIQRRGDYAGAWETVEKAHVELGEDPVLNQLRADLTTEAADFVRALRRAQQFENDGQLGSALAWYLEARRIYPMSEISREGIERTAAAILRESAEATRNQ